MNFGWFIGLVFFIRSGELQFSPGLDGLNTDDRNVTSESHDDEGKNSKTTDCLYGKKACDNDQDHGHCSCLKPCDNVICPPGAFCTVTLTVSTSGKPNYSGVCRTITKPGRCPGTSDTSNCAFECINDSDCLRDLKCCSNGCGTSCLTPLQSKEIIQSSLHSAIPQYSTATSVIEEEVGCVDSTYGCCPDGIKTSTGMNFDGCDVINAENCFASYFGCCEDGVAAALGPRGEGCHAACESSTYGCCSDNATPAYGPNGEGCCLTSPYKCCPDNIRPALGPNLEGCDCAFTQFHCCPDNVTAARGSDNEGCGCQYTKYGCCPNRFTPATGIDFDGCLCDSHEFGCCPDGISIARGLHGSGCECNNTQSNCFSNQTFTHSVNYVLRSCESSEYGCCPESVEPAQGRNFEGCVPSPDTRSAACGLTKVPGSCSNFSSQWFYDVTYGDCTKFWYSGCGGNGNRFTSRKECRDVCVSPKGRDVCHLPKSSGPCESYLPKWYYDSERKQCGQFIYKGCLGNDNKFETREACENRCVIPINAGPNTIDPTVSTGLFAQGSLLRIECKIDNNPMSGVAWFKNDTPIQTDGRVTISDSNVLIIENASTTDTGTYRCKSAGGYSSDALTVDIQVMREISPAAPVNAQDVCEDNPFFASCELIVKAKYCDAKYYSKFCCKSCTNAEQLLNRMQSTSPTYS